MITLNSADSVLKSFYLDAISESLNMKANPFLAQIERTSVDVVGKDVRKIMRLGWNAGIGAGTETGDLPTAKASNYQTMVTTLKNLYGTIEISDKALRASANNEGAFVNILNEEMNALVKSASYNFGRMLFGDGSGYLATVTSSVNDGAVKVSDIQNFMIGMYVEFDTEPGTKYRVAYVDRANSMLDLYVGDTMTFITSSNVASGSKIYLNDGSLGNELTGLGAIFKTSGELYGLERFPAGLNSCIKTSVGSISESVIQKALDEVEATSGNAANFIICSWGVRRAIMQYYQNINIALPTMEIPGGFTALSFHGIPIVVDRFCPKGTMYLLNTNSFKLHQLCDWQWLEAEDGKILKQVAGKPVYTATLVKYAELLCEQPQGQAMLTGITEA